MLMEKGLLAATVAELETASTFCSCLRGREVSFGGVSGSDSPSPSSLSLSSNCSSLSLSSSCSVRLSITCPFFVSVGSSAPVGGSLVVFLSFPAVALAFLLLLTLSPSTCTILFLWWFPIWNLANKLDQMFAHKYNIFNFGS